MAIDAGIIGLVGVLASGAGVAARLLMARMVARQQRVSGLDPTTGCLTTANFRQVANIELRRAARGGGDASLVLVHFRDAVGDAARELHSFPLVAGTWDSHTVAVAAGVAPGKLMELLRSRLQPDQGEVVFSDPVSITSNADEAACEARVA